jgi:predicted O-methyltransferase YrrM
MIQSAQKIKAKDLGNMTTIEKLLADRPAFHRLETEIDRSFQPNESCLAPQVAEQFASDGITCYAIAPEVLRFLADSVSATSKTLETGAGLSTLIFALRTSKHVAVTPSKSEITSIRDYAADKGISLDSVSFICEASEEYLPGCRLGDLDLILLDGKHAFPWPMVDWFYTADRLKQGGLMIIDDAQMRSVGVLRDFMAADPAWNLVRDFAGKTIVFQKLRAYVHDVAWHMQPWNVTSGPRSTGSPRQLVSGVYRKARRVLLGH